MGDPTERNEARGYGVAWCLTAAAAFGAVLLCSSSAETGGAMMFRYPGVNCISESVPADGIFDGTNPLNPTEYRGTAVENAISVSPGGVPVNTAVEVFCPIPYVQILKVQEFFPSVVDLRGSSGAEGLLYYEVEAFVDDNTMLLNQDVKCIVLATDAEVDGSVFDWESSSELRTQLMQETVLRWSMLGSAPTMSTFLTLHCVLPPQSGVGPSQIIGYGLKKARMFP